MSTHASSEKVEASLAATDWAVMTEKDRPIVSEQSGNKNESKINDDNRKESGTSLKEASSDVKEKEKKENWTESNKNEVIDSFDDMGLREHLLRGIYSFGFEKPSRIQQMTIKPFSTGLDMLAQAQSGTGKCLGPYEKVLMANGSVKQAKDIVAGDLLVGDDGLPRVVMSLASGEAPMFRVYPADVRTHGEFDAGFTCHNEHLIILQVTGITLRKRKPEQRFFEVQYPIMPNNVPKTTSSRFYWGFPRFETQKDAKKAAKQLIFNHHSQYPEAERWTLVPRPGIYIVGPRRSPAGNVVDDIVEKFTYRIAGAEYFATQEEALDAANEFLQQLRLHEPMQWVARVQDVYNWALNKKKKATDENISNDDSDSDSVSVKTCCSAFRAPVDCFPLEVDFASMVQESCVQAATLSGSEQAHPCSADVAWLIGFWIGDGTTKDNAKFSQRPDSASAHALKQIGNSMGLICRENKCPGKSASEWCLSTETGPPMHGREKTNKSIHNPLCILARRLGMWKNKNFPSLMLGTSRATRLSMLAGLLDADGYYGTRRCYEITQSTSDQINGIVSLARSLGYRSHAHPKHVLLPGGIETRLYYRASISGERISEIPCRTPKKCANHQDERQKSGRTYTIRIEKLPVGPYYGFTLAHLPEGMSAEDFVKHRTMTDEWQRLSFRLIETSGRFLLGDCTVTHNTATFIIGSLQKIDPEQNACQSLILSPTRELAHQTSQVVNKVGDYLRANTHTCVGSKRVRDDRPSCAPAYTW